MKKFIFFIFCFGCFINLFAQKQKADSLAAKYAKERIDSNKVKLLWMMADASYFYNPDTALLLAQRSLYLAQKIKYAEGESRALGAIATSFKKIGNYPTALEFYLQKLKIDETRNSPRNLASTYINIGSLYVYLEQYNDALAYYTKADSVIQLWHVSELEYYSNNDLGDVYERMNVNDSAFLFFSKALANADKANNNDFKGASMVGLGHIYLKENNSDLALQYYLQALKFLRTSNNDDLVCETTLGLAKLYENINRSDSAEYYALYSFSVAKKDGFEARQLNAATFLSDHYKKAEDIKKAFTYIQTSQALRDSIYSNEKIRQSQIISSDEQLRQNEIAENKKIADEERHQQLQLLVIGIFIPLLFLVTLLLSRIKISKQVIKFLAVISLLMFFEYLLLLLHPQVEAFTNHKPFLEILIFVAVASVLIPGHHRVEHWLVEKLTKSKIYKNNEKIIIDTKEIRIKKSPGQEI